MAKQTINVGTTANDRKGDSLRAAFQKVNANFTELYTALGLTDTTLNLGAFEFNGSTMTTTDSTPIVIDQSTTITSDLTVGGDILPQTANGGDLGSAIKPWKSLYVSGSTIYLGNAALSVDTYGELLINDNRLVQDNGNYISLNLNVNDVHISDPQVGDALQWAGGFWVNGPVSGGSNTGDITFAASTVSAGANDEIVVQAKAADNFATARLNLEPEFSTAKLSAFSSESVDTFTAGVDFTSGVWQDNGYGNGEVSFTGAQSIGDLFQNTIFSLNPDNVTIQINSEPAFTWNGGAGGVGTDTPSFGTNPIVPTSPITITSITFTYRRESYISVDYDNQAIRLNAQNAGIRMDANQDIEMFGDNDINLQSTGYLRLSAGLDIEIGNGSNDQVTINTGDFNVTAYSDISITALDDFDIRNDSASKPINIITDNNDTQKTWAFNPNGTVTFPDGTIQTTAYTGSVEADTLDSVTDRNAVTTNNITVGAVITTDINNKTSAATGNIVTDVRHWESAGASLYIWFDAASKPDVKAIGDFGDITGWTVSVSDGNSATVTATNPAGYFSISTSVALTGTGTLTFTSPDYAPASSLPVDINVGANTWTYGTNGSITFPDNTVQTTAWTGLPTYFNGDMSGSVFADDSTLLVDGVNGIVPTSELAKSVTQVIDNDATVNTSRNVTTNNSYDSPTDFVADVDPSLGFVIPGLSQRNDTEIEVNLFVEGFGAFWTYLLGLALGRTVIATYSTALGNQTYTSTISQVFSGTSGQVDPITGWYRIAGRILGTVPAGYTGLVGINFPVYSTESHTWRFGDKGGLTLPVGSIIPSDTDRGLVIAGPLTADMVPVDPENPSSYNTISNGVNIRTHRIGDNLTRDWTFSWDGTLYPPHDAGSYQVGAIEWRVPDLNIANQIRPTRGNLGSGGSEPPGLKLFTYGPDAAITLEAGLGVDAKWHFKDDGSLEIPGDIRSEGNINIDINLSDSTLRRWTFGEDGELTLAGPITNLRTNEQKISLGDLAGETTQGSNAIAIGREAGRTTQGAQAVAIGGLSGLTAQGDSAVAIGVLAGQTSQGVSAVAIGNQAGQTTQGPYAVAIGALAGETSQGLYAVAMGYQAGTLNQSQLGVAIGYQAGYGYQGQDAVAIGRMAAQGYQGNNAVAIGLLAGLSYQGANAIAIGAQAGQVNQPANSIVLNASGNQFDPSTTGFFVNPLRNVDGGAFLNYNTTTKEIGYSSDIRSETGFNIDINLADSTLRRWQFGEDGDTEFPGAITSSGTITGNILKIEDGVHEKFQPKSSATGTVEHDCSAGHIFYHTTPSANWTANFTNLNLASGYATTVTLVIEQGGTGYYPNAVEIGGISVGILWQGNATPTPSTNRVDVVTFSILYDGLYTVLGQLTGF